MFELTCLMDTVGGALLSLGLTGVVAVADDIAAEARVANGSDINR